MGSNGDAAVGFDGPNNHWCCSAIRSAAIAGDLECISRVRAMGVMKSSILRVRVCVCNAFFACEAVLKVHVTYKRD